MTADTRDPWSLVFAVMAATTVAMLPGTITAFLVGGLIDGLGLSEVQAGALVTLEICGVAIAATLVAPFMIRLSALRLTQAGVVLAAAMQFGSILLDSFWTLVPARLATGVGEGLALAGATAVVAAAVTKWEIVERYLEGQSYLAGDSFSIGDIPVGIWAYRWFNMPIDRPSMPNVEAWYARLCDRPPYQEHIMIPLS